MPWRSAREPFIQYGSEDDGGRGVRLIRGVLDGIVSCALTLAREWDLEAATAAMGEPTTIEQ
jgi:hypothetical protein